MESVGVLVLVDQQVIEAGGDLLSDFPLGQHLGEIEQQVVVIEHVLALLHLDIGRKQRAQGRLVRGDPGKRLAEDGLELAASIDDARIDGEARRLGRKAELHGDVAEARLMARPVHEVGRILAVVDGELWVEAEPDGVFAQEASANGVERARIGRRRRLGRLGRQTPREEPLDPPAKLRRRAAREGGEHDALRIGAGEDERCDPMRQHRRLAGARAGDDEQRPGAARVADPVLDGDHLLRIEIDRGRGANQGERHGPRESCFAVCSQGRRTRGDSW